MLGDWSGGVAKVLAVQTVSMHGDLTQWACMLLPECGNKGTVMYMLCQFHLTAPWSSRHCGRYVLRCTVGMVIWS